MLVSAGFDAHAEDPLAELPPEHRAPSSRWRGSVRALARERGGAGSGVVLEGGYNQRVLAECVCATLPVLAGEGEAAAAARRRPADGRSRGAAREREQERRRPRAGPGASRYWPL